jgi:glutamyl-Q tRNA(Asp) synthetase
MSLPVSDTRPVFRFAPSPNGYLHLGHARSALLNAECASTLQGRFLLRIEDIDKERTREPFVAAITEDLAWLGLAWERPVLRQSTRFRAYAEALDALDARHLLYPCFCSRQEISHAVRQHEHAAGAALPRDPDGTALYPGTCHALSHAERRRRAASEPHVLRLDMARALAGQGALHWVDWQPETGDRRRVEARPAFWGDAVIRRRDTPASYHLAVVVDDAYQNVSHVLRGADLSEATHLHVLLQALLGLPVPLYHHHPLILDDQGRKLSKSLASTALRDLRASGVSPSEVRRRAIGTLKDA